MFSEGLGRIQQGGEQEGAVVPEPDFSLRQSWAAGEMETKPGIPKVPFMSLPWRRACQSERLQFCIPFQ